MRWTLTVILPLVFVLPAAPAFANSADHCFGDTLQFRAGFAAIATAVGPAMGSAITCEYPDPNGTGDTEQMTTTGLSYWRKSTNTPTFTNGATHWAITGHGVVAWQGQSVDPPFADASVAAPPVAAPPPPPPAQPPAPQAAPGQMPYDAQPGDSFPVVRGNWAWLVVEGHGASLSIAAFESAATLNVLGAIKVFGLEYVRGNVKHLGAGTTVRLLQPAGSYFAFVEVQDGGNAGIRGNVPNKAFHS